MARKMGLSQIIVLIGTIGLMASTAFAGTTAIGSVVGSKNATLDGVPAVPRSVVFNGDSLQVNSGGIAMVALDRGNRMVMGRGTEASFKEDAEGVMVSMARGNMSLFHPNVSKTFRVRTGDVTVAPEPGYKTLGELAMVDGLLVVTAKDGALQVEKSGTTRKVTQGKTITISTTAARAPVPVPPPGNRHIKRVATTAIAIGIAATAVTIGIIEVTFPDHRRPAASSTRP